MPPLPPLECLRFFEAAARRESFAKAAEELHVSSSAVAHRIKVLEEHVGVVQLQPDAVGAARVHGEADPVLGRTGRKRRPGALGPGDDGGDGERRSGSGRPSGGRARLRDAGRGRLVGMPSFGIGASGHGRDYRLGYGLTVAQDGAMHFEFVPPHRLTRPSLCPFHAATVDSSRLALDSPHRFGMRFPKRNPLPP